MHIVSWDVNGIRAAVKKDFYESLEKIKPVVACSDFNVAHRSIDLKNDIANYNKAAGYTQIDIDGMDNLIDSGLVDNFPHLHPDKAAYTYRSYRFKAEERNTGWRIDYFLVSSSLIDRIRSVNIYSEVMGSDHCPIGIEIDLARIIKQFLIPSKIFL